MAKAPVLFIGHGTPMNAIETNQFTDHWRSYAEKIGSPRGIIVISAHWYTDKIYVNNQIAPKTIYDMYGFPREIYEIKYNAKSSEEIANKIISFTNSIVSINNNFGYDHGIWSILKHMYPEPDFPIVPMSVSYNLSTEDHFNLGKMLAPLRDENYLIMGTGGIIHNLSISDFNRYDGFDFCHSFDDYIYQNTLNKDFSKIIHYENEDNNYKLAVPTPEHFLPYVVALGATDAFDHVEVFNKEIVFGALSMTSYFFNRSI